MLAPKFFPPSSDKSGRESEEKTKPKRYLDIGSEEGESFKGEGPEWFDEGWKQANKATGLVSLSKVNLNKGAGDDEVLDVLESKKFKQEEEEALTELMGKVSRGLRAN